MNKKTWTLDVEEDPETGDAIIQFPEDFLAETNWQEGDKLRWIDNGDGSWTLEKIDTLVDESVINAYNNDRLSSSRYDKETTQEEEEAWQELERKNKK
jgi:hypothetical protein